MTYLVMTSSAQVKGKAKQYGNYRNVAVVEADDGAIPKMISERARGVRRIVRYWGACNVGSTDRCAYARALAEAEAMVKRLNGEDAA